MKTLVPLMWLWVPALFMVARLNSAGTAIQADGLLTYTNHLHNEPRSERHFTFSVRLFEQHWNLRVTPLDPGEYGHYDVGDDRDGSVLTIKDVPQDASFTPQTNVNNYTASVLRHPFRDSMDPEVKVLVLAFVGERYLSNSPPFPAVVSFPFYDQRKLEYTLVRRSGSDGPVSALNQYDPGTFAQAPRRHRDPPFDKGFRCQKYSVTAWSDPIDGLVVPSQGELVTFLPAQGGVSTNDLVTFQTLAFAVTNISRCEPAWNAPEFPSNAMATIADTRIVDHSVVYNTNRWLSSSEAQSIPTVGRQIQGFAVVEAASDWTTSRKAFVLCFLLLNGVGLGIFLVHSKRKYRTKITKG